MTRAVVVLLVLASATTARAGGWTRERGGFYAKLSNRLLVGDRAYLRGGELATVPRFVDDQVNLYLEVGVHPRVTVIGQLTPWGHASVEGAGSAHYLGPFVAGARVGLLTEGPLRVAVEAHYGYAPPAIGTDPIYDAMVPSDGGLARPVVYRPAIETHRFEVQGQLGRAFRIRQTPAWFSGSLGVRLHTDIQQAITGYAQVGVQPWRFRFDLHLSLYEPFFQSLDVSNVSGVGDTRYLGIGIGIAFALTDHVGLTLDADGALYAQSNAGAASFSFGLEARR